VVYCREGSRAWSSSVSELSGILLGMSRGSGAEERCVWVRRYLGYVVMNTVGGEAACIFWCKGRGVKRHNVIDGEDVEKKG